MEEAGDQVTSMLNEMPSVCVLRHEWSVVRMTDECTVGEHRSGETVTRSEVSPPGD